jgi:riboflavin synthase
MFTGIVEAVGSIAGLESRGRDLRVSVDSGELDLGDVKLGDSIAVNGICLTAVALPGNGFIADVSAETLERSTFASLQPGSRVNLEKALTPTTRLGGHLVSGHVDGIGEVIERRHEGRSVRFYIKAPDELARYIATKGSITVDGISLTVNGVNGAVFELNLVPHTLQETTMHAYTAGQRVNLEVDLIARYLERLVMGEAAAKPSNTGISEAFLAEHGFLSSR